MINGHKSNPIETAKKFVSTHFPDCEGALLSGSVIRGEATNTSDLDIIVFDGHLSSSFRETSVFSGWDVELFAYNLTSYQDFFQSDLKRARPSLPRMVAEGFVIADAGNGFIDSVKAEATHLLKNGPAVWSEETIKIKRYFITDVLLDFEGSIKYEEDLFIVKTLIELVSEFILRTNQQWLGESKWIYRALAEYDIKLANSFVECLNAFYQSRNKQPLVTFIHEILNPFGGRLYEGFSIGKNTHYLKKK